MNRVSLAEPKEEPLTCSGLFVQILDLSTYLPFCVKTVLNHRKTNRQLAGIPSPFASSLCSNRRGYSSVMAQNWELNCKVRPAPSCPYSCCLAFRSAFAAVLPWQGWLAHSHTCVLTLTHLFQFDHAFLCLIVRRDLKQVHTISINNIVCD